MSKENQNVVSGVDPKTYGGFDKFMDGAQKVTKYVLPVLGASLTAGCSPEMIDAISKTVQAGELSPLPTDPASTPTPNEELHFEITPTVENPETQEWTLVPESEVATETLVPTETPEPTATVEPTSEMRFTEFSRKFFLLYTESYVAEIEGMQIPISLGLSREVTSRSKYPIKTAHIAEDVVPILAEIYLKSCHHRFTNMMEGNEGVTYEEYVELVREGKGNLEMYVFNENKKDRFPELMSIDPRQGFAISLVDELLPMELPSDVSLYAGSDGSGKYFVATQVTSGYVKTFYDDFLSSYGEETVWAVFFQQIYLNAFAPIVNMENDCLKYADSMRGKCSLISAPRNWLEINQKMTDELIKTSEGKRGPIFEMTQ